MKDKVAIIHTSTVSLEELKRLFEEFMPQVELINIIDDSLLNEVKLNNGLTPGVIKRICIYAQQAQNMGAKIILNQCSSVGEAVDIAKQTIHIPYIKIDEPMASKAVEIGKRIAVIATVSSTLEPSCRLIKRAAENINKEVIITPYLVEGALDILMKENNVKKHNQLVLETIKKAEKENDVIVLAQGSMIVMLPYLEEITKTVLTSPKMGVLNVQKILEGMCQ